MTFPYVKPMWEVIPLYAEPMWTVILLMLSQRRMTIPYGEPIGEVIPLMLSQRSMTIPCGELMFLLYAESTQNGNEETQMQKQISKFLQYDLLKVV